MANKPKQFPPWSIPKLADLVRGSDPQVVTAFTETEKFLYSLVLALVQGLAAVQSPTKAKGDMIFKPQTGPDAADTRLPIGVDGQFLGIEGGLPTWEDLPVITNFALEAGGNLDELVQQLKTLNGQLLMLTSSQLPLQGPLLAAQHGDWAASLDKLKGQPIDSGQGVSSPATLRTVLASDQPAVPVAVSGGIPIPPNPNVLLAEVIEQQKQIALFLFQLVTVGLPPQSEPTPVRIVAPVS